MKVRMSLFFACFVFLVFFTGGFAQSPETTKISQTNYDIAYDYTVRFYPRWFTWTQSILSGSNQPDGGDQTAAVNRIAGPLGMGPEYKVVVAINDDTIYAQAFLDLSKEPQILTIPAYDNVYSILQLDVFGNVLSTPLSDSPPTKGGTYILVGPNYKTPLPDTFNNKEKFTIVKMPYNSTELILRIDKFSSGGVNQIKDANEFRAKMLLQSLDKYDPSCSEMKCGKAFIAPLFVYGAPIKTMADEGITFAPEAFLDTLREAMASPTTEPLTASDRALIQRFNSCFDAAKKIVDSDPGQLSDIIRGAQAAHSAIINRWQSHKGTTNWIHFDNIGYWGTNYLDRAALTEYIQYGNDRKAAYYANAFVDDSNIPLNGNNFGYTIRFDKSQLPQAKRFWSITAYTPEDIELVDNPINKYLVASYTPGLVTEKDGSITVYVQATAPKTADTANWLPVPKGPFSLMLRIYGPEGKALDGTYVPPKIHRTTPR